MSLPDAAGEKKAEVRTSLIPFNRVPSGPGCDVIGMITRRMRLVLLLIPNGITG